MLNKTQKKAVNLVLAVSCMGAGLSSSTGCQVSSCGQTLPSPYYLMDDIQYFPAGPENKLSNETAALKAAREKAKAARR